MRFRKLLLTCLWLVGDVAQACQSNADCSYNGICNTTAGTCACDAAWKGTHCTTLNLLPARPNSGLNASSSATDPEPDGSWGGTITKHTTDKTTYHMFVAQFVNRCGFNQWYSNSRIVHAVSDTADGEYKVQDVVVPVWAHNPAVVRGPMGEWILTYVSNSSWTEADAAVCANGTVVRNATKQGKPLNVNYMMVATDPNGPWSEPMELDSVFDDAVPPFLTNGQPNRNTNLVLSVNKHGVLVGLWRRCCTPPPKYAPPGGGGASVVFSVHSPDWEDPNLWKPNSTALFPTLPANGYEDPHIYRDPRHDNVFHAVFHDMVGGWHKPEFNNTRVGAHAYSDDGGHTWVSTGVAFDLRVEYQDGTTREYIQRERPHMLLGDDGYPAYLVSGVTWNLSEVLNTCTIVQPIATKSSQES